MSEREEAGTTAEGRSVEHEVQLDAPPERVWRALTEAEELRRWFPLDARIEPRPGGEIWLSWGPGCEGTAPLAVVDEPRHLRWIEESGGGDSPPVRMAVDFHLEARGGGTFLRLVHSGFGPGEKWDDWYDATDTGWRYFLFNLRHYLERHRDVPRTMVWTRRPPGRSHQEVWSTVTGPDGLVDLEPDGESWHLTLDGAPGGSGEVVLAEPGAAFAGMCPGLDDALLFVELEGGGEGWHCGVWLSTWRLETDRTEALQEALDRWADRALGPADTPARGD